MALFYVDWKTAIFRVFCLVIALPIFGLAQTVNITFSQQNNAYFVKPLSHASIYNPLVHERQFAVTHSSPFNIIQAQYGQFSSEAAILHNSFLTSHLNGSLNPENLKKLDISAHIVSPIISRERPVLRVLCHASHLTSQPITALGGAGKEQKWCLQLQAQFNVQRATTVCVLSDRVNICTAEMTIPESWWSDPYYHSADVFYSYYPFSNPADCSSWSNSIKTTQQSHKKFYIGQVTLVPEQIAYKELKEDQHILIYVPGNAVTPNSKFRAQVKLQAESNVRQFNVRVRVRHGLRLIGVETRDVGRWHVSVNINNRMRGGFVTATVVDEKVYSKSSRIQDIFDFVFQVESVVYTGQEGRIVWMIDYQPFADKSKLHQQTKAVVHLPIYNVDTYEIVPVYKVREVLNMAMLSSERETWLMQVFAVRLSGQVDDITHLSTCHADDERILKVMMDCRYIYVDGNESLGSNNATIHVKHADQHRFIHLPVWVPEMPVQLEVSDNKLSQVKGWKVPDIAGQKPMKDDPDDDTPCHLNIQQAVVKVFTKFSMYELGKVNYWLNRKALLDVTNHVKKRLRVSDSRIARLRGNIVEGKEKGRTEIQVLSTKGRVIGAKEIRVSTDKVTIKRLDIQVVTGIHVYVIEDGDLPGMYKAKVDIIDKMNLKNQEGFLDVFVHYSDETIFPLHNVPMSDYQLELESLDHSVIEIGNNLFSDRPPVRAVGQGKGELLGVSLKMNDVCLKKSPGPLAVNYIYINVDFSTDQYRPEFVQNDDNYENRPSDRWEMRPIGNDHGTYQITYRNIDDSIANVKPKSPKSKKESIKNHPGDSKEYVHHTPESSAIQKARQQRIKELGNYTPLEISMYSLLGFVCLAVLVILSYCVVFIVRYRKKLIPHEPTEPVTSAKDWVWIGRATLERNHVNTNCSQALMPSADFNGNQAEALTGCTGNRDSTYSNGSNQNGIATYQGSECSIRITTNPIPDDQTGEANPEQPPKPEEAPWDYEAMGMSYDQLMEYFDNLKESTA